jgi:hypothetical protein
MKTLLVNIKKAVRDNEVIKIGGGEFSHNEIYKIIQLYDAAVKAQEALTFSYGGEPLPTLEKEALDALKLII